MTKKRKHKKKITGLQNLIRSKNYGRYFPFSTPLVQCMGLNDALFLTGLSVHYQAHKDNLKSDRSFYISVAGFQNRYGLKKDNQQASYRNIHLLGLCRRSKLRARDNARSIILNNTACLIWVWMIYRHLREIEIQCSYGKHPVSVNLITEELSKLYKAVLNDKPLRIRFKNFIKEMIEYSKPEDDEEEENYESGEQMFWDDELEMFYEEFVEHYKKKL